MKRMITTLLRKLHWGYRRMRGYAIRVELRYATPCVTFPPVVIWCRETPDIPAIGSKRPNGLGYLISWKIDNLRA